MNATIVTSSDLTESVDQATELNDIGANYLLRKDFEDSEEYLCASIVLFQRASMELSQNTPLSGQQQQSQNHGPRGGCLVCASPPVTTPTQHGLFLYESIFRLQEVTSDSVSQDEILLYKAAAVYNLALGNHQRQHYAKAVTIYQTCLQLLLSALRRPFCCPCCAAKVQLAALNNCSLCLFELGRWEDAKGMALLVRLTAPLAVDNLRHSPALEGAQTKMMLNAELLLRLPSANFTLTEATSARDQA